MQIFIDGEFFDKNDAKISVYDHGLLYGDGIFEGIRIYNNRVFKLIEHIDRLYEGAQALLLEIPYTKEEMTAHVLKCVELNENRSYIRLVVTRGVGKLGFSPIGCKASVIIIVDDITLYPEEFYEKGIKLITSSIRRTPVDSFDVRVKSLNYLNNIMAKIEAINAGCLEAVMLNHEGFVAECTGDNIFIIKNGVLITPSDDSTMLHGITRNAVIDVAAILSIPVEKKRLAQFDLYTADEVFLTGSAAGVIPVTEIDKRIIGKGTPGVLTLKISDAYNGITDSL